MSSSRANVANQKRPAFRAQFFTRKISVTLGDEIADGRFNIQTKLAKPTLSVGFLGRMGARSFLTAKTKVLGVAYAVFLQNDASRTFDQRYQIGLT